MIHTHTPNTKWSNWITRLPRQSFNNCSILFVQWLVMYLNFGFYFFLLMFAIMNSAFGMYGISFAYRIRNVGFSMQKLTTALFVSDGFKKENGKYAKETKHSVWYPFSRKELSICFLFLCISTMLSPTQSKWSSKFSHKKQENRCTQGLLQLTCFPLREKKMEGVMKGKLSIFRRLLSMIGLYVYFVPFIVAVIALYNVHRIVQSENAQT